MSYLLTRKEMYMEDHVQTRITAVIHGTAEAPGPHIPMNEAKCEACFETLLCLSKG